MSFFNKKEEVIDIKLTQFGKNLLSRGRFKPKYYRFFDDDILYNCELAGFTEHQNDSEDRILENTPKLRTQHLTFPVEQAYAMEEQLISEGKRATYEQINISADPFVQERILLYPLHTQEISNEKSARLVLKSLGEEFEKQISFLETTGSGIRKNIPQITISSEYVLTEDRTDVVEPAMINSETFINLSSDEIVFADNSTLRVDGQSIIIDLEEINVPFTLDNFEVEIYEVTKRQDKDILRRIKDINEINKLFHITTDEHIEEVKDKKNNRNKQYERGEY